MPQQTLYADVRFDGRNRRVKLLQAKPSPEKYEVIHELPTTMANGIPYEPSVYIDGLKMTEEEAKELVVEILESPILRAKVLGGIHKMEHDNYWNVVFMVDNARGKNYGVLNAKFESKKLQVKVNKAGELAFLSLNRDEYPVEATKAIYQKMGMSFTELHATEPTTARTYIGLNNTVQIEAEIIARSIAVYIQEQQIERQTK